MLHLMDNGLQDELQRAHSTLLSAVAQQLYVLLSQMLITQFIPITMDLEIIKEPKIRKCEILNPAYSD